MPLDTFGIADGLAEAILKAGRESATEQALVVAVETALGPVLDELGIPKHAEYEKTLLGGRADAVYGSVIIEYEAPGKLATAPGQTEAYGQIHQYMRAQAELRSPGTPELALPKLVGVVLDGRHMGFVLWRPSFEPDADVFDLRHYDQQLTLETEEELVGRFQQLGPFPVSTQSVIDLLRFLRALSRRPLEAGALADEFGPDAATARQVVRALDAALKEPSSARTSTLFAEWLRLFGAVYGPKSKVKRAAVNALAQTYDVDDDDVGRMLFAVHTYFALIMKILAVELVALQSGAVIEPLVAGLPDAEDDEFEQRFAELESGVTFRARGIENFLEGDFLGWYVDEWSPELRSAVRSLARELRDFEPGTASLRPELTHDLLKELYHALLPRELRHALGEYYTPDWLAEYTLDRAGYDAAPGTRMLDPACGSGTFLVAAIRRMREKAEANGLSASEAARHVVEGIVGFDLNPLAVIAARTNYLLAAGDLIGTIAPFRIPVFICDSITVPARPNVTAPGLEGKRMATSVGEFVIPDVAIPPRVLPNVMSELEFCADNEYTDEEFIHRVGPLVPSASDEDAKSLTALFRQICNLKSEGRDGIWPRLLSNAFAPLFAIGGFDHVIGNPPWISWEEVSPEYREETKPLWKHYGLFTLSGGQAQLGGGKKDMSMLMTYVAAEEYLKPKGRLTFLITQTVLQTHGAGDGFRGFDTGRRTFRVRAADDLANFNPFDDASNWTAIVSLDRDAATTYPVPYRLWNRLPGVRMARGMSTQAAMAATQRTDLNARPVRSSVKSSPWLVGASDALDAAHVLSGTSDYAAKAGITVWLDGVFQAEVLEMRPDGLVRIRNLAGVGKTKLDLVEDAIEPDLLFPYVPWAAVGRWAAAPERYLLVPQDPATRAPYPVDVMRKKWPRTLAYLRRFEKQLRARSGYKRYFKDTDPFYAIYNVSPETVGEHKVIWRTMGTDMQAALVTASVAGDLMPPKPTVFKNTVIYVKVDDPDEAGYLTALLNSTWANYFFRASNVRGGKSAFATSVLRSIRIPTYNARSGTARELSRLATRAAGEAASGDEGLDVTEALIDEAAARFWDISARQQEAMRASLDVLGGARSGGDQNGDGPSDV
jgi:SAM-dependent methyltransferase